jgi:hypothetical protein
MRDVSVPAWVVVAVAAGLLLVVGGLVVATLRARRRIARRLDAAHAEAEELRHQVEEIRRRLERPAAVRAEQGYVITEMGGGFETGANAPSSTTGGAPSSTTGAPMVPAPLFADMVLRESVLQAAALAAGLRRALSPESRNRIRFEMRREVKRARKQRRADLRAARRDWEARQRTRVDLDEDSAA